MDWQILLGGLAVAALLEGVAYAAAPNTMRRMAQMLSQMPTEAIRQGGLWVCAIGLGMLYLLIRFG